jgi:flagellar L-ring protein precursor FlgH
MKNAESDWISSFFGVSKATLGNLGAGGESSLQSQAKSSVQQQGKLSTKLAGRVVKAYPNRTMLIEAEKTIVVNGAGRVIKLRGIVRPEDIDSTNTVSSDKIANLEVFVDGKGYSTDGGKPGWFLRLLSSAFPF